MSQEDDDNAFADISNNFTQLEGEEGEIESAWQALERHWPEISDNAGVLTKAFIILEYVDNEGDRCLRLTTSPDLTEWDADGMLSSAKRQLDTNSFVSEFMNNAIETEDDDDDDE